MSAGAPQQGPAPFPPLSSWKGQLGRLFRLVRKELGEVLRDRRTIVTLVLMPILIYPLLAIVFQQYFLASKLTQRETSYLLGFLSEEEARVFFEQLKFGAQQLRKLEPAFEKSAPELRWDYFEDLKKSVDESAIDLGVRVKKSIQAGQDQGLEYELIYKSDSPAARRAVDLIEKRIAAANGQFLLMRLGIPDLPPVNYLRLVRTALPAPPAPIVSLAALIPLILILMTITGAVYPAIDLTAGERERGTLEILVAAPVPRMGLLLAKYVTVLTVAVLTALVNLVTMMVTLLASGLGSVIFAQSDLSFFMIVQLLGLLVLFAAFFSAVLLTLTSFARSFKEAQAYLIPLMLLSLAPGVMGMLPGLSLEGLLAVVPLVNIVLLARDMFEGGTDAGTAIVVVVSTLLYALAAIAVAARIFGSEGVLYNEQSSWSELWRRPADVSPQAKVSSAMMCLALMFPAWFVVQGVIAQVDVSLPARLAGMALFSVCLFAGFPLLSAHLSRVQLSSGCQFRRAPAAAYLAGILLGFSLWPLVVQLLAFLRPDTSPADLEHYEELLKPLREARSNYPILMALAFVAPALAEELFFRGYLFSALKARSSGLITILASAALFGIFHVIVTGAFALERLAPSTLLGLVLGWVAWTSGSVVPAMILHGIHNAMLVLVGQGEAAASDKVPWTWIAGGLAGTIVGAGLLQLWGRGEKINDRER